MTMMAGRPRKPTLPRCTDCGGRATRARLREDAFPGQLDGTQPGGYDWLCSDCEYRRVHPDALPALKPPREREVALQRERLFDL